MKKEDYLSLEKEEIEKKLNVNLSKGHTQKHASELLLKNGKNELPKSKSTPWFVLFLKTLIEPVQLILIVAAIISIIAPLASNNWVLNDDKDFIDFGVILSIVFIDATLETVQAVKARKSVDALKQLSKPKTVVLRDNTPKEIEASELVVGDIVVLEAGRYIPADLRIIEDSDLMIDESALTGESVSVNKSSEKLLKSTNILAEMKNIAFMSTFITNGRGLGVVISVGKETEIGKIAQSINSNDDINTPLEKKLTIFSYWIAGLAFIIGAVIFASLYLTGDKSSWISYLMVAITLAIGVIPESLSAVVSITLSISTKKMANQNVIVKKLSSVETLGSVNIICTDKTGTLTKNKMTVKKVILNGKVINNDNFKSLKNVNEHDMLLKSLVLCNDSVTEGKERIGDPTELALVDYAELFNLDEQDAREKWKRLNEIPFDSERKMMTTINDIDGKKVTFTKGAIDQLLKVSNYALVDGKKVKLTDVMREELLQISKKLSSDALRILAFAYNENYKEQEDIKLIEEDLIFIGGVAMIDPVRESAVVAIKEANDAGIEVVMITGDHPTTALAIAKDLDLAYSEYEVMSSDRLSEMSDEQLSRIIQNIKVFARVNPEHKVRIVSAFQEVGNITSMTGDGVNDAPSLAKADIGVAMGISGTDVAKQASDVILTDDNFQTIMKGVCEGRNVYQKIRRAIAFVIGVNMANVLSIFILSLINHTSPLEATDILWMNLVIESVLAINIGMSQNDNSLMKQKPMFGKNSLFKNLLGLCLRITIFTSAISIISWYVGMSFVSSDNLSIQIANGNIIKFNSWTEALRSTDLNSSQKIELQEFGRTAMFLAITCAPSMFVNVIKLSNWKASKKIYIVWNFPLLIASMISILVNCAVLFIPGLNDQILDLPELSKYNSDNWYLIFIILAISFVPTLLLISYDFIRFFLYHYKPESWRRNRLMLNEMIKTDNKKTRKKNNK